MEYVYYINNVVERELEEEEKNNNKPHIYIYIYTYVWRELLAELLWMFLNYIMRENLVIPLKTSSQWWGCE